MLWYVIVISGRMKSVPRKKGLRGLFYDYNATQGRYQAWGSVEPEPGVPLRELVEEIYDTALKKSGLEKGFIDSLYIGPDIPADVYATHLGAQATSPQEDTGVLSRERIKEMIRESDTPEELPGGGDVTFGPEADGVAGIS